MTSSFSKKKCIIIFINNYIQTQIFLMNTNIAVYREHSETYNVLMLFFNIIKLFILQIIIVFTNNLTNITFCWIHY